MKVNIVSGNEGPVSSFEHHSLGLFRVEISRNTKQMVWYSFEPIEAHCDKCSSELKTKQHPYVFDCLSSNWTNGANYYGHTLPPSLWQDYYTSIIKQLYIVAQQACDWEVFKRNPSEYKG